MSGGNFLRFQSFDFLCAGFNRIGLSVAIWLGVSCLHNAQVVEKETDTAGLAQGTRFKKVPNLRGGAIAAVGKTFDYDRNFMRCKSFVGHQLEYHLVVGLA